MVGKRLAASAGARCVGHGGAMGSVVCKLAVVHHGRRGSGHRSKGSHSWDRQSSTESASRLMIVDVEAKRRQVSGSKMFPVLLHLMAGLGKEHRDFFRSLILSLVREKHAKCQQQLMYTMKRKEIMKLIINILCRGLNIFCVSLLACL